MMMYMSALSAGRGRLLVLASMCCWIYLASRPGAVRADWPDKPLRWVVPTVGGAAIDSVTRVLAARLSERVGQPVVIDNRPGAANNIGMALVASAAPDGYTLMSASLSFVINPVLYKLEFEPERDFAAAAQVARTHQVLVIHPSVPARTVPELLAAARASPGEVTCGGAGGAYFVACSMLRVLGKADIPFIPYRGGPQVMHDLVGGRISLMFEFGHASALHVSAGRLIALATANPARGMGRFGHLPTMAETLPGFEVVSWIGIVVPRGVPGDVIARINREIAAILADAKVRHHLETAGIEVAYLPPDAFARFLERERSRYGGFFRSAGIRHE